MRTRTLDLCPLRRSTCLVVACLLAATVGAVAAGSSSDVSERPSKAEGCGDAPSVRGLVFKQGYPDYAPSGMPDFSQDHLFFPPTLCGPTAVANCLWWFDSKFEGHCGGAPGDGADDFPLVTGIGIDDHDFTSPEILIRDLEARMHTDPVQGTRLVDMEAAIHTLLTDTKLDSSFTVNNFATPFFTHVACEVRRSENVILLLGLYWRDGSSGQWKRCGGHFVTVAGVNWDEDVGPDGKPGVAWIDDDDDTVFDEPDETCPCGPNGLLPSDDICGQFVKQIYISDPGRNYAESGGAGLVHGPDHSDHAPAASPPPDHDNAVNVSHDLYDVTGNVVGASLVGYGGDVPDCEVIQRWCNQNPNPDSDLESEPCDPLNVIDVSVEIEAMLTISPVTPEICIQVLATPPPPPLDIRLGKGPCTVLISDFPHFNFIRGELCQVSESTTAVDLGIVDCLVGNTSAMQIQEWTTPDITRGIGAWFFLVGRWDPTGLPPQNYGYSSSGNPRNPSAGNCP
jgi:hypothetical protein